MDFARQDPKPLLPILNNGGGDPRIGCTYIGFGVEHLHDPSHHSFYGLNLVEAGTPQSGQIQQIQLIGKYSSPKILIVSYLSEEAKNSDKYIEIL